MSRRRPMRRVGEFVPSSARAAKTRFHGDFHLGQVLLVEDDVILIDFEGEPGRPIEQRNTKHSPLRDVAGMLRSFDYAAHAALDRACADRPTDRPTLEPQADEWLGRTVATFLCAYRDAAAEGPSYPDDPREADALIRTFVLEKALYEVRYELDNRPDWVGVPLRGLRRVLASG